MLTGTFGFGEEDQLLRTGERVEQLGYLGDVTAFRMADQRGAGDLFSVAFAASPPPEQLSRLCSGRHASARPDAITPYDTSKARNGRSCIAPSLSHIAIPEREAHRGKAGGGGI